MEQAVKTGIEKSLMDYGLIGLVVIGALWFMWKVVSWLLKRVEAKDEQLAEAHGAQLEVSRSVVAMAEKTAKAMDALTEEVRGMGKAICENLERIKCQSG